MRAVGSSAAPCILKPWRAVEAQHIVSTLPLVDSLDEQALLERLLDESKPAIPVDAAGLHWLLFTPFRYPPPPGGSRFRGEFDPGVFYAAEQIETACAELGYWRWRHLRESPTMEEIPPRAQTVFQVSVRGLGIDLRAKPFARSRAKWTSRSDYAACQAVARDAREAGLALIRYESVRDPDRGGCAALLSPAAFASPKPLVSQTWQLSVLRDRVIWRSHDPVDSRSIEFLAANWEESP